MEWFQKLLKAGDDVDGNITRRSPSWSGHHSRPTSVSGRHSRPSSVSGREGTRRPHRGGLHAGLISAPQNDLRHTLHVGYDGAVFGDVSFIDRDQLARQTDSAGLKIIFK